MVSSVLIISCAIITVCGADTVVNCPAPRSPDHGQAFLYQDGSVVKYACDPGYNLLGREIARCVDGEWETPLPICVEMSGDRYVDIPSEPMPPIPPSRPLFDWSGEKEGNVEVENQNVTAEEGDVPMGDQARLRMVVYPNRRRARVISARVRSASELEEEERKRSEGTTTTTIHLKAPPPVVYVRRTVSPGKSESQEQTLKEQYRTATVHMSVDNPDDKTQVQVVTLPRAAVVQNDKGEENLRHMYWMAQHYYPRQASLVDYRTGNPYVTTLSDSQIAWINSLHPELRDQYLRDLYNVRVDEAAEGARAHAFLMRYGDIYNPYYGSLYMRQPVSLIAQDITDIYDYSCNQASHPFVRAPKLPNAHIARYDSRQNSNSPHNHYLTATYRCNPGYMMLDTRFTELHCSKRRWIGTEPICVPSA